MNLFHFPPRFGLGLALALALIAGNVTSAEAQSLITVHIESTPPGATVYLDSLEGQMLGTTPIRSVRIRAGAHTLVFVREGYQEGRLPVNVRKAQETFRLALQPLGTLEVVAGNEAARGASVIINGEPKGLVPLRETVQPGRHFVQVRREGHETFGQWVEVRTGQVLSIPVALAAETPRTGSILVAGDVSGARILLNGEPRGVTPVVLDGVPEGEHVVEIRPDGLPPHEQRVVVRAGERVSVNPSLRPAPPKTGSVRVLTVPAGALVIIDGEPIGESPATKTDLVPGEHIVEAIAEGYERAEQKVTIEAGQQRAVSLRLERGKQRQGRIIVNANTPGAQVLVDGQDRGTPPVVVESSQPGTHAIVVTAPGYLDVRTTCEVGPEKDCVIQANLEPARTPVRFQTNARDAELYVNGELVGPVPFEGTLPVGSHRIEVRAPGFETHAEQVRIVYGTDPRVFDFTLVREGEADEEVLAEAEMSREQRWREATSHSASPLPADQTVLDVSVGWPYIAEVRLAVGILDLVEAGIAVRTFGRLTEFEGRALIGYRPVPQISFGGQVRLGGGIGPTRGALAAEGPDAESHPTNSLFFALEGLATLHFARAGAFTTWLGLDMYTDRWDWEARNRSQLAFPVGTAERQNQVRARLGGALELIVSDQWNVWGLFEGIIASPEASRRIYGDILGGNRDDTELYFRLGGTYKFGVVR